MPSIKIDGKVCTFEGKKTILQVALENDLHIPHYCYHPGLSIVAICRICLAEVAQPNPKTGELQRIPKLVPTCQHPAVDGSEVYMSSQKTVENQKAVMEYLLINHPLDCPVCDQAGECHLQDYSYEYGRAHSRFEEDKIKQPKKDVGDHVLLYSDRCIMCSRCVRFTREVSGTGELCIVGRGASEEIDVFPGKALNNPLSGNVVDICPVGALLDKEFLFEQRVWFLTSTPSIDGITASGDNIVIDHNEGVVYRIKPRQCPEVNKWWISDEIRYGWKFVHDERRLTKPRIRRHGAPEEADWPTAYASAIAGLTRIAQGGGRIALLASPMLSCEDAYLLGKAIRAIDANAILAVGPVPFDGEDQTFPGGYTIYAEKAPNARGVRRALQIVAGGRPDSVLAYEEVIALLERNDTAIGGMIATGNYPTEWAPLPLSNALADKFLVLIDTLPNALTADANVLLPSATWAEKSGTFENVHGRLQAFMQAIAPIEFARPEGQIAMDLLTAAGARPAQRYDAAATRCDMGGPFADQVHLPTGKHAKRSQMEFVEI